MASAKSNEELRAESKKDSESEDERERIDRLRAAVSSVKRVRYKVRRDTRRSETSMYIFLVAVITACTLLASFSASLISIIITIVISACSVVVAITVLIVFRHRKDKIFYCYYKRDERGIMCMSVSENTAVVFARGDGYRINDKQLIPLAAGSFGAWFDGECSGLYSIYTAEANDIKYIGTNSSGAETFTVRSKFNSEHAVVLRNGVIEKITSSQPNTNINKQSGIFKNSITVYEKFDPSFDFEWEIPKFIRAAFESNGAELPELDFGADRVAPLKAEADVDCNAE